MPNSFVQVGKTGLAVAALGMRRFGRTFAPHPIRRLRMPPRGAFSIALFFASLPVAPVEAQDTSTAIVGVWRVVDVQTREVVSGKTVHPFGEHPSGSFVFTQGGHMSGMQFASDRRAASGANATESERAALFSSMTAYSGTYRVEGRKVVISVENSSVQSWNGTQRVLNVDIAGARLTGTSEVFRSLITGLDVVGVITWEKVE
jgi:hypothetical protein